MSGWLETSNVKAKWTAVGGSEGNTNAAAFAEASITIISIFDLISGMGTAKSDMEGNAKTLAAAAGGDASLQSLVEAELNGKDDKAIKKIVNDGKTTTCALLWLVRALTFIKVMLEVMVANPGKSMKECVGDGYAASLKPYHNMLVKGVFSAALNMAPKREDFVKKLGAGEQEVMGEFSEMLKILTPLLDSSRAFLVSKGVEK